MIHRILAVILLLTIFSGCGNKSEDKIIDETQIKYSVQHFTLGSINYVGEIEKTEKSRGTKEALNKVMDDVNSYGNEIDTNNSVNAKRLYTLVSQLIYRLGYIDKNIHYFRNKLNRVPNSLEEMLKLNSVLPDTLKWKLIPVRGSLYHCQGKDGLYNLKFVASDGFCEAVYNKNGILLTEKSDPVNMGTFNYCAGMPGKDSHGKYDVEPYLKWGNAENSPQKGASKINKGVHGALTRYNESSLAVEEYRTRIIKKFMKKASLSYLPLTPLN